MTGKALDTDPQYRGDIDGLRAVAILLVVAFHVRLPGTSGGFVGVDVFFAISGWLITRQLFTSVSRGERPRLLEFWARRVRRLVPAAAVMVAATFGATFLLLSPLEWRDVIERGVAALLYGTNLLFAHKAGDYFSGPLQDSPFLHTWSLGVEEQFYLVWPLIFASVGIFSSRRSRRTTHLPVIVVMGAICIGSFALNLILVRAQSPWAFFSLPTRAWEFASAGLVATVLYNRRPLPRQVRVASAVVGGCLIVGAVTQFDGSTPFPGWHALVPVFGTVLLLVAGHGVADSSNGPLRVLDTPGLRWLGRLSYAWYLWHWPFIVLTAVLVSSNTTAVRLAAAGAALGAAAVTHHLVENPVRFSQRFKASPGRTYVMGAAATGSCLLVAGLLFIVGDGATGSSPHRELELARRSFQVSCPVRFTPMRVSYCEGGDPDGTRTLLLTGDSHAGQWFAAFDAAAGDLGLKVVLRVSGNCSAVPGGPTTSRSCEAFQRDTATLIAELHPDFVVLADALGSRDLAYSQEPSTWARSAESYLTNLSGAGIKVGLVRDNPQSDDPLLCLSRGRSVSECTPGHGYALEAIDRYRPFEDLLGVPLLDVNDHICGDERCLLKYDDTWVFAASSHLTREFTLTQLDRVNALLSALNGGTSDRSER